MTWKKTAITATPSSRCNACDKLEYAVLRCTICISIGYLRIFIFHCYLFSFFLL